MRLQLKMENNNVTTTKAEVPVQVTTTDPKKVAAGQRLAEWHCRNKEKLAQVAKAQGSEPKLTLSQAYGIGSAKAVRVLGLLGYYIYQSKKGENMQCHQGESCSVCRSSDPKMRKQV